MHLPAHLREAIQYEIEKSNQAELAQAVGQLTQHYKSGRFSSPAMATPAQRAAYLAVRMPATFAASLHVLSEIRRMALQANVASMLDLGAGPGTSAYAAAEVFPALTQATMIETDRSLSDLGQRLSRQSIHAAIRDSTWLQQDLRTGLSLEPHDLVVVSYTLNELSPAEARKAAAKAWQFTGEFLAIVEPGTMRGFGFIHAARDQLIVEGAHILAPCPHDSGCPMAAAGDWCHFAQRIERTSLHRRLKSGALGYEDEKFSYVVASRTHYPTAQARIVRHPQKHSGHVQLLLCTLQGLEKQTVAKSGKENYKRARKAEWGDAWGGMTLKY